MKIESISYKHGMLKKLAHKKRLRAAYFTGDEISDEIKNIIEKNDILSLSGFLGSKQGGTPVEYEEIRIKADGEWLVLEVYNRGLSVVYFETPELKRVFPLCSKLRDQVRK